MVGSGYLRISLSTILRLCYRPACATIAGMTRRRATFSTAIIAIVLTVLAQFGYTYLQQHPDVMPPSQTQAVVAPGFYKVARVIDGDTIMVTMGNTQETVRFIGVDTPETHKPDTPVQCFGPQASDFTTRTLTGKTVRLEADPTNDDRDRYGRLLRYVYLPDGSLVEKTIIDQGYGFAYLSFPFQKKDEFAAAQNQAQAASHGLWAACKPFQESGGRWQTPTQ